MLCFNFTSFSSLLLVFVIFGTQKHMCDNKFQIISVYFSLQKQFSLHFGRLGLCHFRSERTLFILSTSYTTDNKRGHMRQICLFLWSLSLWNVEFRLTFVIILLFSLIFCCCFVFINIVLRNSSFRHLYKSSSDFEQLWKLCARHIEHVYNSV